MFPWAILASKIYHYFQQLLSLSWMLFVPWKTPTGSRLTENFPGLCLPAHKCSWAHLIDLYMESTAYRVRQE